MGERTGGALTTGASPLAQAIEGFQSATYRAAGWRRRAMLAGAGAVSALAMAPIFAWPVLFLTLPVLLWAFDQAEQTPPIETARQKLSSAFGIGWWFGFGYFLAGMFWIGEPFLVEPETFGWLLPFAITLMPAGLALFFGAATLATSAISRPGWSRLLALAAVLFATEWARGHILTGFPWNTLGYALTADLWSMQLTAVIGTYGMTMVVVAALAAPLYLASNAGPRNRWAGVTFAVVVLGATMTFGALRLSTATGDTVPDVRLRLVQPAIRQADKWRPELRRQIFEGLLALSATSAAGVTDDLDGITHVIWPEASIPFLPLKTPEALRAIGDVLPPTTHLLAGAIRFSDDPVGEALDPALPPTTAGVRPAAYNALMVFNTDGLLVGLYDKTHLVPFGEYLPLQPWLEAIGLRQLTQMRGGFASGATPRVPLAVAGLPPVGALICYEVIFPGAVGSQPRPGVLLNVTNDAWFGQWTGPFQHFHQTRVRAVEEGLPLLRVANGGVSAVISPEGRVLQRLGLNVRGVIDTQLPVARPPTLYSRFGDLPAAGLALALLVLSAQLRRASKVLRRLRQMRQGASLD